MSAANPNLALVVEPLVKLARDLEYDFPSNFGTPNCLSAAVRLRDTPLAVRFDIHEDGRRLDVLPWVRSSS